MMNGQIVLYPEQQAVVDKMLKFMESKERVFLLEGHPGTGKSTLLDVFLSKLSEYTRYQSETVLKTNSRGDVIRDEYGIPKTRSRYYIYISAPTHKALYVVRDKISFKKHFCFCTAQKAMGLQMDYDENGKTIWEYKDPSIEGGSLLWIIDECSMINNQLYENIIKFHKNRHTLKIIFVGDRYQLPPVNESMSKTFDYSNTNQYALMKKIVRNDGTIVDCCKQIRKSQREFVSTGYFAPIDFKQFNKGNIKLISFGQFLKMSNKFLEEESFYFAYHNKVVDKTNEKIRQKIFGDKSENLFNPGEKLLVRSYFIKPKPFPEEDDPFPYKGFYTCYPVVVKDVTIETKEFIIGGDDEDLSVGTKRKRNDDVFLIECYVLSLKPDEDGDEYQLFIKTKTGDKEYEKARKKLYKMAMRKANLYFVSDEDDEEKEEKKIHAKEAWKLLYEFKNKYNCPVGYNYALTTHKGQGMTVSNSFVNTNDILFRRDLSSLKSLYTAISRGKDMVYLVV